jgi:hypothetical protein
VRLKGQVEVKIILPLILNISESLIGQIAQPVNVRITEITKKKKKKYEF